MSYQQLTQYLAKHPDFVAVDQSLGVIVDLKYADRNNFLGEIIYHDFATPYLHRIAYGKLVKAVEYLTMQAPALRLKIFDCTRPPGAQQFMWDRLQGSPEQSYLADPAKGSIHSFGFAVDLTLCDEAVELDMGTAFDAFTPLSEPRREREFRDQGRLTQQQLANRHLLRDIMQAAGFTQLPIEWWHFDALPADEVRRGYRPVNEND